MLSVNNHVVMKRKGQSKRNNHKKDVKVTYISSPMKVKTSPSNFRALVQELTGQASNIAELMFVESDCEAHYAHDDDVPKGTGAQQWSSESAWLKPDDYGHLMHSEFSMEPLNQQFQYELLSFDMMS